VVNALTGAAIGAGTKMIFDKITGKPTVVPKTSSGTTAPKAPAGGSKAPAAGGAKAPAGGTKQPTSVVKTPAGGGKLDTADVAYKGTPADPSLGLPAGTIDNGDGTYTITEDDGSSMTYSMENDSPLYATDTDGKIQVVGEPTGNNTGGADTVGLDGTTVEGGDNEVGVADNSVVTDSEGNEYYQDDDGNYYTMTDGGSYELAYYADGTPVDSNAEAEYFLDGDGNYYTMNADGSYDLAYYADGTSVDDAAVADDITGDANTEYAETTYTDPDTGEVWNLSDTGVWTLEGDEGTIDDTLFADDTTFDDTVFADDLLADESYDYGDYDFAKKGGLITMMKKGGMPHFEDGGYSSADGVQYFDDGSSIQTFDDGSTLTFDSDGNVFNTTEADQTTRDDAGNYIVTDSYGNMTVYDPNGNLIPVGGGRTTKGTVGYSDTSEEVQPWQKISNSGTVGSANISKNKDGNTVFTDNDGKTTVYDPQGNVIPSRLDSDFLKTITGALGTTAGAAGAGALIASLLGGDLGGSESLNQGIDMSQVGLINPRTTDFGIGPTNFVGYDQYGTGEEGYVPNEELLRNLNAPGFNPVREGDYGYEEVADEELTDDALPAMASGGLSSMSTPVSSYYTFGQPADILANLGMRPQPPTNPPEMTPQIGQQKPPMQAQQQGLPQQAPPMAPQQMSPMMPQQGMMPQQQGMPPPMRKGGLPHVSNVPLVEGRMDFRNGSAVHGEGDGQSDDIPAMLADGEYVIDSETVAQIGNGSTKAGAQALDKFREGIRAHKRSAPINKIPPKTKALTSYLKGAR